MMINGIVFVPHALVTNYNPIMVTCHGFLLGWRETSPIMLTGKIYLYSGIIGWFVVFLTLFLSGYLVLKIVKYLHIIQTF